MVLGINVGLVAISIWARQATEDLAPDLVIAGQLVSIVGTIVNAWIGPNSIVGIFVGLPH